MRAVLFFILINLNASGGLLNCLGLAKKKEINYSALADRAIQERTEIIKRARFTAWAKYYSVSRDDYLGSSAEYETFKEIRELLTNKTKAIAALKRFYLGYIDFNNVQAQTKLPHLINYLEHIERIMGFSKSVEVKKSLSSEEFWQHLENKSPITDIYLGTKEHGTYIHRIQWALIYHEKIHNSDFLKGSQVYDLAEIYSRMGGEVIKIGNTTKSEWSILFDALSSDESNFTRPETLSSYLHDLPFLFYE